jgi:hypothetical protein
MGSIYPCLHRRVMLVRDNAPSSPCPIYSRTCTPRPAQRVHTRCIYSTSRPRVSKGAALQAVTAVPEKWIYSFIRARTGQPLQLPHQTHPYLPPSCFLSLSFSLCSSLPSPSPPPPPSNPKAFPRSPRSPTSSPNAPTSPSRATT